MARYVATPSLPNKEGNATEYKGMLHGWKRCYLKLDRTYLHSYEALHSPAPLKSLLRFDITGVYDYPYRNSSLEITTKHGKSKSWIIEVPEEELHDWKRCLIAHLPSAQSEKQSAADSSTGSVEEPSLADQLLPLPGYMRDVPPPYDECVKQHQT
ncbi:hypothetical protein EMCRGX_G032818 [Ephydatia muelleri]|eukprot:Em0019g1091a